MPRSAALVEDPRGNFLALHEAVIQADRDPEKMHALVRRVKDLRSKIPALRLP